MSSRRLYLRTPHFDKAKAWADEAASGNSECRLVRLAAQRFITEYEAAQRGEGEWVFDTDYVEAAVSIAQELPNIKGPEAGKKLKLMDWQRFIFANVFGFKERARPRVRRFRQGTVWVP